LPAADGEEGWLKGSVVKKLLFLGAGIFQLDGIRAAREASCHVISVDNLPGNVGHRFADETLNISTTDVPGLLDAASHLGIDGVFSMASDVALNALSRISSELRLPGPSSTVVKTLVNKEKFRWFQERAGLPHPRFASSSRFEELQTAMAGTDVRIVFKPAASSGSRGIGLVEGIHSSEAQRAFENAASFSRSGLVVAEEYVDGVDITAEGIVSGGDILYIDFTRRHTDGFAVIGHEFPAGLDEGQRRRAMAILSEHLSALGYEDGPFDADLRVRDQVIHVIELTPRLGGNGVPWLIQTATGVPLVNIALRMALGEKPNGPPSSDPTGSSYSILLTAHSSGSFEGCRDEAEMKEVFPELFSARIAIPRDRHIRAFRHGGHTLGFAIVKTSELTFSVARTRLAQAFALSVRGEEERAATS